MERVDVMMLRGEWIPLWFSEIRLIMQNTNIPRAREMPPNRPGALVLVVVCLLLMIWCRSLRVARLTASTLCGAGTFLSIPGLPRTPAERWDGP